MADNTIATAYVQLIASADGISKSVSDSMGEAGEKGSASFGKAFGTVAKTVGAVVGTAITGISALTSKAVQGFSEYEQLVGGMQKLFGEEDYTAVMQNADQAFKTAGMSANEYMQTVTSFSASLISSLGGDTEQAVNTADWAIQQMSDNANTFGTSMESIQHAYMGFAKGNFTMLDNLSLGFGGTKSEMERLLREAEEYEGYISGSLSIDSFADIIEAIGIMQEKLGIAGTTSKEAMTTIQGSLSATASAWSNLVTGIANDEADFGSLIDNLVYSLTGENDGEGLINQLIPRIQIALEGVGKVIEKLVPVIISNVPPILQSMLPMLLSAVEGLVRSLISVLPTLLPMLFDTLMGVVDMVLDMLPFLLETAITMISNLFNSIAEVLPVLIPRVITAIVDLITTLLSNVSLLLDGAMALIKGLADGIIKALPILIGALPAIIIGILDFIVTAIPQLIDMVITVVMAIVNELPTIIKLLCDAIPQIITAIIFAIIELSGELSMAGVQLFLALIEMLPTIITVLVKAVPQIVMGFVKAFKDQAPKMVQTGKDLITHFWTGSENSFASFPQKIKNKVIEMVNAIWSMQNKMVEVGRNLISGLWNGISGAWSSLTSNVSKMASNLVSSVKDVFGIHSPSKVFEQIGEFITEGFSIGMEDFGTTEMDGINAQINAITTDAQGYAPNSQVAVNTDSKLYDLLAKYLPEMADGNNTTITLEGDADGLFRMVRKQSASFKKSTGVSAFA